MYESNNNCKWYNRHKWVNITRKNQTKFLNEYVTELVPTEFRMCSKCGIVQERMYDSTSSWYSTLKPQFRKILVSQLLDNYVLKS